VAWFSGWSNRKKITIAGSSAGAQTNYQMKLTVHKGSGSDSGSDVYLLGHCKDDFSDIRFTKSDGETELDYWIEEYTSGDNAVVWIEFDSIPASPDSAIFYLYYGNSEAPSASNGDNTFLFFDDFLVLDTDIWTVREGYYSAVDGELMLGYKDGGSDARSYIAHFMTLPTNYRLHYRGASTGSTNEFVVYHTTNGVYSSATNRLGWWNYGAGGEAHCIVVGSSDRDNQVVPLVRDTYYNFRVKVLDRTYKFGRYTDHTDTLVVESNYKDSADRCRASIGFYAYDYGIQTLKCDWIFVAKLCDPEPTWGSWGVWEPSVGETKFNRGFN